MTLFGKNCQPYGRGPQERERHECLEGLYH